MAKSAKGRAARENEGAKLTVKGLDAKGNEFQEETKTIDISESGVSFYLKTPIWMDSHMNLEIRSSSIFGPLCHMKAKVVRLRAESSGRQHIGARFD